jgi:hypothetical protein
MGLASFWVIYPCCYGNEWSSFIDVDCYAIIINALEFILNMLMASDTFIQDFPPPVRFRAYGMICPATPQA